MSKLYRRVGGVIGGVFCLGGIIFTLLTNPPRFDGPIYYGVFGPLDTIAALGAFGLLILIAAFSSPTPIEIETCEAKS